MSRRQSTGKLPEAAQFVGLRVVCRSCGDNRHMGTLGLSTIPGDDGEPWFKGPGVEPAGWHSSLTLRCDDGHNVPLRIDRLWPLLRRMHDEAGPRGRRVETVAL